MRFRTTRRPLRPHAVRAAAAAIGTAALILLAAPLAASAHVHVSPDQSEAGADDTLLTFTVPTESASASTVKVVVNLPTATPFTDVVVQRIPGWTSTIVRGSLPKPVKIDDVTITEAPVQVVWTATKGEGVPPGEFQNFAITAGPMPDVDQVMLPVSQTYSSGTVVKWDEATPKSGEEPDNPAPVVYVNATAPDEHHHSAATTTDSSGDAATLWLSIAGLAIAAFAAVLAALALRRSRA